MSIAERFSEFNEFEARVAGRLRDERKKAKISLLEMSEKIGLHQNTCAKVERNDFGVGLDVLFAYAKVLGLPIQAFLTTETQESEKRDTNVVGSLTSAELLKLSNVMQDFYSVFTRHSIRLCGRQPLEATELVASAILSERSV